MKTFTLAEANALIPQLEQLVDDMRAVRAQLLAMGPSLESVVRAADGNGGSKKASAYVRFSRVSR
ncbi:MAG: DUF2203 family protein [Chloroflexi bacterium]|nr:DUF2203 family protein [Chloroflexota bacterium]